MDGSWDACLASPADFAVGGGGGEDDIITNREPGIFDYY